jgi:hypothetical protein
VTPEQQQIQLQKIAKKYGKTVEECINDAVNRYIFKNMDPRDK